MSDMKCPFCQQELKELYINGFPVGFRCKNKNCPNTNIMCGTKELWQELIRTRKELEQSESCCTEWEKQALDYKAENISLSGDLDRIHKALEVIVDKLKAIKAYYDDSYADPNFVNWHSVAQRLANDADDAIKSITTLTKGGGNE